MEAKFTARAGSFFASLLSLNSSYPTPERTGTRVPQFTGDTNHPGEPIPEQEGLWEDLRALNYTAVKWQVVFSAY